MKNLSSVSDTWAILLPADTTWIDRRKEAETRTDSEKARGTHTACVRSPWALHPESPGHRTYIAFPSHEQPLLITSRDAVVLRYLTESVLASPPGSGRFTSLAVTVGRRLLRRRSAWSLAAKFRVAGIVSVQAK